VKENVEHMLSQIDELTALLDVVRLNIETTQTIIPSLLAQLKPLERTFVLIDAVEQFVRNIEATLDQLESKVAAAEHNTSKMSQAKRVLSSFPGMSKMKTQTEDTTANATEAKPEPIRIMDSRQFFSSLKVQLSQNQ